MNNAGSTMVEVIVGFVILVMVLAECMVHLLGVSGELVKKTQGYAGGTAYPERGNVSDGYRV